MSLCQKPKSFNSYICTTWSCTPFIFQTKIIWSTIFHTFKYLRSSTLGCKDIRIITWLCVKNSVFSRDFIIRYFLCISKLINFEFDCMIVNPKRFLNRCCESCNPEMEYKNGSLKGSKNCKNELNHLKSWKQFKHALRNNIFVFSNF